MVPDPDTMVSIPSTSSPFTFGAVKVETFTAVKVEEGNYPKRSHRRHHHRHRVPRLQQCDHTCSDQSRPGSSMNIPWAFEAGKVKACTAVKVEEGTPWRYHPQLQHPPVLPRLQPYPSTCSDPSLPDPSMNSPWAFGAVKVEAFSAVKVEDVKRNGTHRRHYHRRQQYKPTVPRLHQCPLTCSDRSHPDPSMASPWAFGAVKVEAFKAVKVDKDAHRRSYHPRHQHKSTVLRLHQCLRTCSDCSLPDPSMASPWAFRAVKVEAFRAVKVEKGTHLRRYQQRHQHRPAVPRLQQCNHTCSNPSLPDLLRNSTCAFGIEKVQEHRVALFKEGSLPQHCHQLHHHLHPRSSVNSSQKCPRACSEPSLSNNVYISSSNIPDWANFAPQISPGGGKKEVLVTISKRYIPPDILRNILIKLPASSLQRLKSVSNEWFRTISDQDFAEAHLTHQSQVEFGYGFLIGLNKNALYVGGTLSSSPNPPQYMYLPGAHGVTLIHGSCKGLILFQCTTIVRQVSLHVANPITRDSLCLPPFYGYSGSLISTYTLISAGIGCSSSLEIKVVVICSKGRMMSTTRLVCGVFTLGSSTWREVDIPNTLLIHEPYVPPIFAVGNIHWKYDRGVLSLDLRREKFRRTEATFCTSTQFMLKGKLLTWNGGFAVLCPFKRDGSWFYGIWLLRESGWIREPVRIKQPNIEDTIVTLLGNSSGKDEIALATTIRNGEIVLFWQIGKDTIRVWAYDCGRGVTSTFTQFDVKFFEAYRQQLQQNAPILGHVNSMVSCSSTHAPNYENKSCTAARKIEICEKRTITLDLPSKLLTYFGCTMRNLLGFFKR